MPPSPLDIQELVNHCITLAADDMPTRRTPTLLACALVARSWVETAQSHLFRAPHHTSIGLWDPWRDLPLVKLHRTLDTSPHLLRHVRHLEISLTVDSVVKLATFMKFRDLSFTHVETISIFIRRDPAKGYSRGIRKLFSLLTPVSIRLDVAIYDVSSFAQIWEFCSPSILHLELIVDIELLDQPWAQVADFIPEVAFNRTSSDLDHIDVYPFALHPFDLSHLKALSIRNNTGVPWQRFTLETIQLLDVDATTEEMEIDLALFPHLSLLRLTPVEVVPPMIMIDLGRDQIYSGYHDIDLDGKTGCALLDSKLLTLPMRDPPSVEFEVHLRSSEHEAVKEFFPGLLSQDMLRFVERHEEADNWWKALVNEL
ncbi:hypothetical protein B0H13DRAFT_1917921 [Mycena leptocephala]|nr:hypothetical protein B0H13DRAFT_1917921 [Mycena leptocephala]